MAYCEFADFFFFTLVIIITRFLPCLYKVQMLLNSFFSQNTWVQILLLPYFWKESDIFELQFFYLYNEYNNPYSACLSGGTYVRNERLLQYFEKLKSTMQIKWFFKLKSSWDAWLAQLIEHYVSWSRGYEFETHAGWRDN